MPSDSIRSDAIYDGFVEVPAGKATPLREESWSVVSVTLWNRTGRDIGIGGANLETDEHLPPGDSFSCRVRDLAMIYVFQRGPGPVRLRFTYEV